MWRRVVGRFRTARWSPRDWTTLSGSVGIQSPDTTLLQAYVCFARSVMRPDEMTGVGTVRDVRLYLSVAVEVVVPVMASRG